MLKDKGFQVPDINMKAYMKARAMTQEFIDDFLGYFMDPTNKHMSSLLLKCGLPGGMMGSMMADLKGVHSGINMILRGKNEPELSIDDLLVMLFDTLLFLHNVESTAAQRNGYYLEKAWFLRCDNVSLGYTFKTKKSNKYFSSLRVYAAARNLFVYNPHSGRFNSGSGGGRGGNGRRTCRPCSDSSKISGRNQ